MLLTKMTLFFDGIFCDRAQFPKADIILGGDWNLELNNELDMDGGSTHANKLAKNFLQSYINLLNLSDI